MRPLRVVTLWRPWDYAIAYLDKRVENRGWEAPLDCPWMMAVRGGQTWQDGAFMDQPRETGWPPGYVSCLAEIVRYERPGEGEGRWRNAKCWGWCFGRVVTLAQPILWPPPREQRDSADKRSMQGLVSLSAYEYDQALLEILRDAWGRKT